MLSIITYGLVPMRTKKQAFYHTHTTKNSFVLPRRCSKRPFLLSFLFPFFHLISKEVCGTFKTPLHFCFFKKIVVWVNRNSRDIKLVFYTLLKFSLSFWKMDERWMWSITLSRWSLLNPDALSSGLQCKIGIKYRQHHHSNTALFY